MTSQYNKADITAHARALDVDFKTAEDAFKATDRFDELVREHQTDHPNLHPSQCVVNVLETDEGKSLYAKMNPPPILKTKALRARVFLLDRARQAIGEIVPRTVVVAKDSSIVNCALRVLADSVSDKAIRAKVKDFFNG